MVVRFIAGLILGSMAWGIIRMLSHTADDMWRLPNVEPDPEYTPLPEFIPHWHPYAGHPGRDIG